MNLYKAIEEMGLYGWSPCAWAIKRLKEEKGLFGRSPWASATKKLEEDRI